MKTIAIVGVLVGGLAAAACGCGSTSPVAPDGGMAGKTAGAAGSSGTAGTGGAAGSSGTAGTGGAAGMSGTCGKVQPCGGSLVGSWTATTVCFLQTDLTTPEITDACPTAKLQVVSGSVNGTATFMATTYENMGTVTLQTRLTMPLSCLGPGNDCADLQQVYVDQGFFQSPTCAVQGTSCVCALNVVQDSAESGTYTTSGTTFTTTDAANGQSSTDSYCVVGNQFHSIGLDMAMPMGPMGMANIQGDVVFTKR